MRAPRNREARVSPKKPRIAVVLHMIEEQPFGLQFKEDFEAAIAAAGTELDVEFVDSHGKATEQVEHLQRLLGSRPDALVLMAIEPESVKAVVRRYREADIPVIVVDNDLGEPELYRSLLLPDNRVFGRKMGEFFVEATGGRAQILELRGMSSPAAMRSLGFRDAIAAHAGMRIVETRGADWLYSRAREAVLQCLPHHPEVDCVFAQNDEMARGALEAAGELGRAEELLITGVDAIKGQGLSLVLQSKLAASLINPSAGRPAAVQLLALLAGEPMMQRSVLQTSLIRSNERIRAWQKARAERRLRA
jgi:ABC-type sugar transport system substrate-binding protein